MSTVAILMRTKNSDWVISQSLNALFSQENVEFTLYIVDSGSTDSTLEICSKFPHKKIMMKTESYIPGPVINDAISEIPETIIVMLNSDSVLLHPQSLMNLINPLLNEQSLVATVGRQLPRHDAEPWVIKDYTTCFPDSTKLPDYITLSFPLSAFKRSAWEKEKFYEDSWGSEDTEWGKRIKDKNMGEIRYIPNSTTMHSHNYNNQEIHNRKFIEGEADYFIYKLSPNILKMIIGYFKRSSSEFIYYLLRLKFFSILNIYVRNFYYFLGYYNGLKSAKKRDLNQIKTVIHKQY
jgi:rhamnosyltransferase